jgi:hypothetical protein
LLTLSCHAVTGAIKPTIDRPDRREEKWLDANDPNQRGHLVAHGGSTKNGDLFRLLYPPLPVLPCFQSPNPARHVHQLMCHGVAGCHGGRRPCLLHEQLLPALERRHAPFELPELIPHGSEALNELCDILQAALSVSLLRADRL